MEKADARLLNPTTQNYLRQQAIRLREQGKRIIDIATYLGVHRNTVTDWWKDYQTNGEAGLTQQQRGAKFGEGRTLSAEQESQIQEQMRDTSRTRWGLIVPCGLVEPYKHCLNKNTG